MFQREFVSLIFFGFQMEYKQNMGGKLHNIHMDYDPKKENTLENVPRMKMY